MVHLNIFVGRIVVLAIRVLVQDRLNCCLQDRVRLPLVTPSCPLRVRVVVVGRSERALRSRRVEKKGKQKELTLHAFLGQVIDPLYPSAVTIPSSLHDRHTV
jgi:hypothetical protein